MPESGQQILTQSSGVAYQLRLGRRTIDKLGVRLYDKPAAVIAELVSNAYDADAETVRVSTPTGIYLGTKGGDEWKIVVEDDGLGMTPEQVQDFYLVVGSDRRADPKRGEFSPGGRAVTGRKGVGKLAPFGICRRIEILTSGGKKIDGVDPSGAKAKGYRTAHLILDYDKILTDEDGPYPPDIGPLDGTVATEHGTKITLSNFLRRLVPAAPDLSEQIAQRFGMLVAGDWVIELRDIAAEPATAHIVSTKDIDQLPGTAVKFEGPRPTTRRDGQGNYVTLGASDEDIKPGFTLNEKFYPVTGWLAYARDPVRKPDLYGGVRIYCRGKFAAQTTAFNIPAGFHGELQVKSYLIGALDCDWLDEEDDLIHTDRQNILWSTEIGTAFEEWGQQLIRSIGRVARQPDQQRTVEVFADTVSLETKLGERYPQPHQKKIRDRARKLATTLAQKMKRGDAENAEAADDVLQLALAFAPHVELSEKLRAAADNSEKVTLGVVASILHDARFAETQALGAIVMQRIDVIHQFRAQVNKDEAVEADLQRMLEEAPWLINPEWSPIASNRGLKAVREAMEKKLTERIGAPVILTARNKENKRPDFVLMKGSGPLLIVEIKKPRHEFNDDDFDRLHNYVVYFEEFFEDEGNADLLKQANVDGFEISLITDGIGLTNDLSKRAYKSLRDDGVLSWLNWQSFLSHTETVHKDFLEMLDKMGGEEVDA